MLAGPRLVQDDAQRLPLPSNGFDTVICTLGLRSVPDDGAAASEMHRVLRPGGRLLLLGHVATRHPVGRAVQRVLNRTAGARVGDTQDREVLPLLRQHDLDIEHHGSRRLGIIEHIEAVKRS